jgi:hypothetical protein
MKFLVIVSAISSFTFNSCSSNADNSNGNGYLKTVNIEFDITPILNSDAIINRALNNTSQTDNVMSLPIVLSRHKKV